MFAYEVFVYSGDDQSLLCCDSYGAKGYRVTSADELSDILHECLFHSPEGVKLVEVKMFALLARL